MIAMTVHVTYFVHGTTTDNEQGLATGWAHGELSELGIKQSIKLKDQIKGRFDVVFCSDLKRAVDSAKLMFGDEVPLVQDKRLRECDYGDFTQHDSREVSSQMIRRISEPFPNGESYRDVETRVSEFLGHLKKEYLGKKVAIVSHRAPQLALDVIIKGKTWEQAISGDWRHTKAWQPGWDYLIE